MGCVQSKKHEYKTEFPKPPRPAEEVELEEAREAIRQRAAVAAAEAERASMLEKRMKAKAEEAARRALERKQEADRALHTLQKLDDPTFDPLDLDDYDDTTSDSVELKPVVKEKIPTMKDKLAMFENLASENQSDVTLEWGDVPPAPKKLTLPKAFAGLQLESPPPPPVVERRPAPGHIIFPDDPHVYKPNLVTSPVTPPTSSFNGRDGFNQNRKVHFEPMPFKLNADSTAAVNVNDSNMTASTTLLAPPPAPSDLIPKPPAVIAPEVPPSSTSVHSSTSQPQSPMLTASSPIPLSTSMESTEPPKATPTVAPVREEQNRPEALVTDSRSVDAKLAAYEERDALARAKPTIEDVSLSPGSRVSGHLDKYERLDEEARAKPTTADVSLSRGSRVSGHLNKYEMLDAQAKVKPSIEDITLSPGSRVSGHLDKYERLDAQANAPLPKPIDLCETTGETVRERLRWSEQLESNNDDEYSNDAEYHSMQSIGRRRTELFQRAGLQPIREQREDTSLNDVKPRVSARLEAYEHRDALAAQGPPPKIAVNSNRTGRLSGMLAMYEAKDRVAEAEKKIESFERRSVVAAITRQRLVE